MPDPVPAVEHIVSCRIDSPLGPVVLAARSGRDGDGIASDSSDRLCGLWFDGQKHQPDASGWRVDPQHPLLQAAAESLLRYWREGAAFTGFALPLDLGSGTPFQQAVWNELLRIPLGHTVSYGDLARRLRQPTAVRAVAAAVGRNPLSIIVPCHRVLGSDGSLTGYAGGVARKASLLALEGATVLQARAAAEAAP
jgi:methylated-DNA-[protein]-cysteine S-methyltransferase